MVRQSILRMHVFASVVAFLTILCFFSSTLVVEFMGNYDQIKVVKKAIFYSLPVLFLAMPTILITGKNLLIKPLTIHMQAKQKRMKYIVFNGFCLVALACALFYLSNNRKIDNLFVLLQVLELLFGFINITLIVLSFRSSILHARQMNLKL
jgi:hypothetical protein